MKKDEVCALIKTLGIIPAIRVSSGDDAHFVAEAVTQGGIPIVEITLTVPGAVELISHLVHHQPKVIVGAGTVLDVETARRCMDAGASFLTSRIRRPGHGIRGKGNPRNFSGCLDTN